MKNSTTVDRKSDREVVVTRIINAPTHKVFQAWTKAELFRQWWVPKSAPITLVSCEMDVRVMLHELYPSKEALDAAVTSGNMEGTVAQFEQLKEFVGT